MPTFLPPKRFAPSKYNKLRDIVFHLRRNNLPTETIKNYLEKATNYKDDINFCVDTGTILHVLLANEDCELAIAYLKIVLDLEQDKGFEILNPTIVDIEGKTFLHVAAKTLQWNFIEVFFQLCNERAKRIINFQDKEGRTVLHYAGLYGVLNRVIFTLSKAPKYYPILKGEQ